jgi:hypothetical protein
MMNMNRRYAMTLLGSTALAGCQTTDQSIGTVVADVNSIAGAFAALLPQLASLTGMTPDVMGTVSQAIASLQAVATSLGTVTTVAAAQPLIRKVETYVNAVITALALVPLIPPPISTILQAAAVLLPVIEALVNMVVTQPAAVPRSVRILASMTTDQARIVLRAKAASYQR